MTLIKCLVCGRLFTPKRNVNIYCSYKCRRNSIRIRQAIYLIDIQISKIIKLQNMIESFKDEKIY